jgi:hypothetical protein
MKVKEKHEGDLLIEKINQIEDIKATISEFENVLKEIIDNDKMETNSKLLLIKSAYQRTIGTLS